MLSSISLSFSIFPSPDQPANVPLIPTALNTGGSLPDLTSLHFPSPLPTPLDPDESNYPSLSGGSSTGNLANTMTHLGISSGMGLGTGYGSAGEGSGLLPGLLAEPQQSCCPEEESTCGRAGKGCVGLLLGSFLLRAQC